jgi:hypothetical protein
MQHTKQQSKLCLDDDRTCMQVVAYYRIARVNSPIIDACLLHVRYHGNQTGLICKMCAASAFLHEGSAA